ncbi:MAG: glycosyltransferase family 2 protein [Treponema sp.]
MFFFSIIIPVYNTEQYLPRALDSILNQTFDTNRVEIVVVNDGSPKVTECDEIIKEYSSKININYIKNEVNQGTHIARKIAMIHVTSEAGYTLFLDPDDFFEKNALSILYDDVLKNGDADYIEFCFCGLRDNIQTSNFNGINTQERTLEGVLSTKQNHNVCNKCFNTSFVKELYKSMPNFYLCYNEDYYQMGIIDYYAKRKRFIESSLYIYVLEIGITGVKKYDKGKLRKIFTSIYNVEKQLCDFYQEKNCEVYIPMVKMYSQHLYDSCFNRCEINDFFDVYVEILGVEKFKMFAVSYFDRLNGIIRTYEKKMKLLLPIKIVIAPFRAFYRFCKKCNEKEV